MYQAEGSERTEAYLFSRQQSRRESFGCTKQTRTQVQDTQCVLLPNLIGKANGKPSDTATAAEKKNKKVIPLLQSSLAKPEERFGYLRIAQL